MKTYILNIDPVPKPRMVKSDTWNKRPAVVKYWEFKDKIIHEARKNELDSLPDSFKVVFQVPMPESWSDKKKKKMNYTYHTRKPDIDNLYKALTDCLCEDDSYIYRVEMSKNWSYKGEITITVE